MHGRDTAHSRDSLREDDPIVCIDARLKLGKWGGVEQVVIGLAAGLTRVAPPDLRIAYLVHDETRQWLTQWAGDDATFIDAAPIRRSWRDGLAVPISFLPRRVWQHIGSRSTWQLPRSDGAIEGAGVSLVHFPTQAAFRTGVPSVYHPHDLQHEHLPELLPRMYRAHRDLQYRAFCRRAAMVPVTSTWIREDVEHQYGQIVAGKVHVVPLAPANDAYGDVDPAEARVRLAELGVPVDYAFYPAQTFPHKNHVGLLRALARLRDDGVIVHLVCSGLRNPKFFAQIEEEIKRLELGEQVTFLDYVSTRDMVCLYRCARAVAIPSRFEAASAPLWEAMRSGVPTACSNVTSLPRQAGNAAIVFDPDDVDDIARAVRIVWTDDAERARLSEAGPRRAAEFSWERTARLFCAHYRRLLELPPAPGDDDLLAAQPIL